MNNIYVDDKLPRSCDECNFYCTDEYCQEFCYALTDEYKDEFDVEDYSTWGGESDDVNRCRAGFCPLKPLTERLAEERKKVVQEIKTLLKEYVDIDVNIDYKDCNYRTITDYGLKKILDQIERNEYV